MVLDLGDNCFYWSLRLCNQMINLNEGKRSFILWVGNGTFYFRLHYKLPAIYFRYRKAAETWEDIDGDLPTQAPDDKRY